MTKLPLKNLQLLRDELESRQWAIACFPFTYKGSEYFVFVKRYVPRSVAPKYALVELRFVDRADVERTLVAPANSAGVMVEAKELREYFHIGWSPNLGDILQQFSARLAEHIPEHLPADLTPEERRALLSQLSLADGVDPSMVYCTHVRRNPRRADGSPGRRSAFNTQKTEMLRPELFRQLGDDSGLSFYYSADPQQERSDSEIFELFTKRQGVEKGGPQRPR